MLLIGLERATSGVNKFEVDRTNEYRCLAMLP
jgi:hypothetical protein